MYSCTKENALLNHNGNGGDSTVAGSSRLSSVSEYAAGYRVTDSLRYDGAGRLAAFIQQIYDSTNGRPVSASFNTFFSYSSGSKLPDAYSQVISGFYFTDVHRLTYDGQGRIAKDTSLSGSGFVTHYAYPADNIASTVLFSGRKEDNQIDTLFVTNGNIHSGHIYYPDHTGTADSLSAAIQFGYSAYGNPGYDSTISPAIGPLLYTLATDAFGGYSDYISKDAVNKISGLGQGLPAGAGIGISYTLDAQSRVIKGTESLGGFGVALLTFTY